MLLRSSLVFVTWPQLLVVGGGIAFVLVGIAPLFPGSFPVAFQLLVTEDDRGRDPDSFH